MRLRIAKYGIPETIDLLAASRRSSFPRNTEFPTLPVPRRMT